MSSPRFTPEFKEEAVRQVLQRGYSVVDVAERVGVSANSLYKWVRAAKAAEPASDELAKTKLEMQKLKAEVFGYIETFYYPRCRDSHRGDVSPEAFERASAIG